MTSAHIRPSSSASPAPPGGRVNQPPEGATRGENFAAKFCQRVAKNLFYFFLKNLKELNDLFAYFLRRPYRPLWRHKIGLAAGGTLRRVLSTVNYVPANQNRLNDSLCSLISFLNSIKLMKLKLTSNWRDDRRRWSVRPGSVERK